MMGRQFHPSATFLGLRHIPLVALARNSLHPALQMGEGTLTIRVIRRHILATTDIAAVDVTWRFAHQVTIVPRTGLWTFGANFFDKASARAILAALDARNAPLAERARAFLDMQTP